MKHILPLLSGIILSVITSCTDDMPVIQSNQVATRMASEESTNVVYPLMGVERSSLTAFETDWENQQSVTTYNGETWKLPWADVTSGNLSYEMAHDIKKKDGWVMLFHTFAEEESYRKRNYMAFYNQRTGMMKVFYYLPEQVTMNNNGFWHLDLSSGYNMLNAVNDITDPIDQMQIDNWFGSNMVVLGSKSFCEEWNAFQIPLAYAPRGNEDCRLNISSRNTNTFTGNLFGSGYSYSDGTILTQGISGNIEQMENPTLTINGESAEEWIDNAIAQGHIPVDGVSTRAFKDVIDKIKQVASVFSSLVSTFKQDKPTAMKSDLQFTSKGALEVNGDFTFESNTTLSSLNIDFGKAKVGELGAWNLATSPTVYVIPLADRMTENRAPYMFSGAYKLRGIKSVDCDVVINPSLKPYLKDYWVETQMVLYRANSVNIPQIPDYYTADQGTIGKINYRGFIQDVNNLPPIYQTEKDVLYQYDMRDYYEVKTITYPNGDYTNVWTDENKYLPTIFAPYANSYNQHNYDLLNAFLRVKLYMVTEIEGQRDTTMSMRTYVPKVEWDPQMYNELKNMTTEEIINQYGNAH